MRINYPPAEITIVDKAQTKVRSQLDSRALTISYKQILSSCSVTVNGKNKSAEEHSEHLMMFHKETLIPDLSWRSAYAHCGIKNDDDAQGSVTTSYDMENIALNLNPNKLWIQENIAKLSEYF